MVNIARGYFSNPEFWTTQTLVQPGPGQAYKVRRNAKHIREGTGVQQPG